MNSIAFLIDTSHHGLGSIVFDWHPTGEAIASTGSSRVVQIASSTGELLAQVVPPSPSVCVGLRWSSCGQTLAIVQAASPVVVLWDYVTQKTKHVTTKLHSIACLSWSLGLGPAILALASSKGSIECLNSVTYETRAAVVPTRRIKDCSWSKSGILALISDAKQLVLCDEVGTTKEVVALREAPIGVAFCNDELDGQSVIVVPQEGSVLSIVVTRGFDRDSSVTEMTLTSAFGGIRSVAWKDQSSLIVGFESGEVSIVDRESACEVRRTRRHASLASMDYCARTGCLATCDKSTIKVLNIADWANDAAVAMGVSCKTPVIRWAPKGDILALGTEAGRLIALGGKQKPKTTKKEHWLQKFESYGSIPLSCGTSLCAVAIALVFWATVLWAFVALQ